MTSPNTVFTELVSTTMRNHGREVHDQISNTNALASRMTGKKLKRTEDGGLSIAKALEYAENTTYNRYSGYDNLNTQASDVITSAEFPWRQISLAVTASGLEMRQNSGKTKFINLVKTRIRNAMRTFKNNFSADLYSDGTLANQINGLAALVADAGTGTVGGIDSSTWDFWQNKVQSAAAPLGGGGAVTVSATTIEDLMLGLYMETSLGDEQTDLIIASNDYFQFYEKSQLSLKRYTSSDEAQGGFQTLKYKKADVVYDGGSGIPNSRMYFLNTDHFELVVHQDADLAVMEEMRPHNQDAAVIPVLWMGNLVVGNRQRQGVLKP